MVLQESSKFRKIEVYFHGEWHPINDLRELVQGELFRMFEGEREELVVYEGSPYMVAISGATTCEPNGNASIMVESLSVEAFENWGKVKVEPKFDSDSSYARHLLVYVYPDDSNDESDRLLMEVFNSNTTTDNTIPSFWLAW